MSHIFLSYASEDRERVRPLAEALSQQGWSVWWDRSPASAAASFGWRNGCASPGEGVDSCRQRSQIGNPR